MSVKAADSKKVVLAALAGNLAIFACKFVAAFISGSTATMAEAVHSAADSGNQTLLLVGMSLAAKPASERYPFGRASELYFWPFVVALILFSLGGTFAIVEGVRHMIFTSTDHTLMIDKTIAGVHLVFSSNVLNIIVLAASFFFEAMSFRVAFREFKILAKGKPIVKAFFDARDPTIPLVLAEDTTAILGLGVALAAVILRGLTGVVFWDALGSLLIGFLLTGVAAALAWVTHGLLIGKTASVEDHADVIEIVEATKGVETVTQILSVHLGPDSVVLALKVAFEGQLTVKDIETIINTMEFNIRKEMPRMRKIFVEVDAHGDGRGVEAARAVLRERGTASKKRRGKKKAKAAAQAEPANET